ncbi:hypothetical protein [Halorarius halobius]|uniref:hypothetical protein n=1 Tax=Halorarius halobius TaxID=2962671 RepID=UPI0020CD369A|nr:hypothetical protein [Halorarius halobius]
MPQPLRAGRRLHGRHPVAVDIAVAVGFLFAVRLWVGLVGLAYRPLADLLPAPLASPFVLGSALTFGAGFALAAAVYLRAAGLGVGLALPTRTTALPTAGAVLAPALAVLAVATLANGLGSSLGAVVRLGYGEAATPAYLLRSALPAAVLGALGYGLVFHGAVLGTLRTRLPATWAAALTAAVAGAYRAVGDATRPDPVALAVFLLAAVTTVALGFTLGLAYRTYRERSLSAVADRRLLPVVALGAFGLVGVASELTTPDALLRWGLWVTTVAAGAYGTARAESVWPGVGAFFAYLLAVDLVVYAEVVVGLAAPA